VEVIVDVVLVALFAAIANVIVAACIGEVRIHR